MSEETPTKALAPNVKTRPDDARGAAPGDHGQAPFIPTEEQRRKVRELAKVVPVANQVVIAHQLKISLKTLTRHFADDLNEGRAELAIALGTQAVNRAMNLNAVDGGGNLVSKGDPDLLKFTLARLCGWTTKVEVTGKDGGPVESVDWSRFTKEQMLAYGKLAAAQRGIMLNDDGEEIGRFPVETDTLDRPVDEMPIDYDGWRKAWAAIIEQEMVEEAQRDANKVRRTCQSFAEFVKLAWNIIEPGTKLRWNWHMQAMCDHLEAISRGTLHPRLIINVPPGSSKSTIVTVLWQAYEWGPLGRHHYRYVTTSFELGNVQRDTIKTRDLILSEWYQFLWPATDLKTEGARAFSNYHTGTRLGVAFKSITGKRGDRLIVDDPHSLEGAESENDREKATRSFIEGGLNRINDWRTSAVVIVMQRLHENDLTGALLAREFGFIHLMIPMELEIERRCRTPLPVAHYPKSGIGPYIPWTDPRAYDGELMDPGRIPEEANKLNKETGDYAYAGQYQQRPAPRGGGMFEIPEDWAVSRVVAACPEGGVTASGWDFAASSKKKSPYSVRVRLTRVGGDYYIRHVERKHTGMPNDLKVMIQTISDSDHDDDPRAIQSFPQDPGSAGKIQKWDNAELLDGKNFKITPETGDKETRAMPFAAQWGAGRVFLVRGPWNSVWIEEARNFPQGTFKDQIDATARAYAELIGKKPKAPMAGPVHIEEGSLSGQPQLKPKRAIADPWAGA